MFSVQLSGELDVDAAAALGAALSATLAREPEVTVDLAPRHSWDSPDLPYWVMRWVV
jgi:ABC-type transporter Mla MlaB component